MPRKTTHQAQSAPKGGISHVHTTPDAATANSDNSDNSDIPCLVLQGHPDPSSPRELLCAGVRRQLDPLAASGSVEQQEQPRPVPLYGSVHCGGAAFPCLLLYRANTRGV